jgi:hypothetical protein
MKPDSFKKYVATLFVSAAFAAAAPPSMDATPATRSMTTTSVRGTVVLSGAAREPWATTTIPRR